MTNFEFITQEQREIIEMVKGLSEEQRVDILHAFCFHCGDYTPDYICQCSNDE